jgi:hypothetical protein
MTLTDYKALWCGFLGTPPTVHSNKDSEWLFQIPELDVPLVQAEFENGETAIYMQLWIDAFKSVQHLQKLARENGGVWTSDHYAGAA